MAEPVTRYDRAILVDTLVAHQRMNSQYCLCGWHTLGWSHPEHVADVYEQAIRPDPNGMTS